MPARLASSRATRWPTGPVPPSTSDVDRARDRGARPAARTAAAAVVFAPLESSITETLQAVLGNQVLLHFGEHALAGGHVRCRR